MIQRHACLTMTMGPSQALAHAQPSQKYQIFYAGESSGRSEASSLPAKNLHGLVEMEQLGPV